MKLLCSNIILGSDRPIRLHGGLVLGVTFDKKIRSGESLTLMMLGVTFDKKIRSGESLNPDDARTHPAT